MLRELTQVPVPAGAGSDPLVRTLRDVIILPGRQVRPATYQGGPVLPQTPDLAFARHCRNGRPVDQPPAAPVTPPAVVIDDPLIWGGAAFPHFGHMIGDQTGRILHAKAMSIYDEASLLDVFDGKGKPLRSVWNTGSDETARDEDIRRCLDVWLAKPAIDAAATRAGVSADLRAIGLDKLAQALDLGPVQAGAR